jgi:hypothetical protein
VFLRRSRPSFTLFLIAATDLFDFLGGGRASSRLEVRVQPRELVMVRPTGVAGSVHGRIAVPPQWVLSSEEVREAYDLLGAVE